MKVTRILLTLSAIVFFSTCNEKERIFYSNENGRYVQFNMRINSSGEPLENSAPNASGSKVTYLEYNKKQTLKIPVSITSEPYPGDIKVGFSVLKPEELTGVSIESESELVFSNGQLNDTIYVTFNDPWDTAFDNTIHFKLETVSDTSIQIGLPTEHKKFNELTVNLTKLNLRYSFPNENQTEIQGIKGETVEINVLFPDGFFVSQLDTTGLVSELDVDFAYSLTPLPFETYRDKIVYILTVEENINNDSLYLSNSFVVKAPEHSYVLAGYNKQTIAKPENIKRDVSVNTAANFYNLNNIYYRTYGENWMNYNNNVECKWKSYFAFTYPVVVEANHPNAILYSDNGTPSPSDDIYHHAFRIGFSSPAGNTTNPFNLKRWFNNNSIDVAKSPGFIIPEAIEFYPANDGTSKTEGTLKIIKQDLKISASDSENSYLITIEGEGTYSEISDGVFEMVFELHAKNDKLFGGTQVSYYHLYNTDTYEGPEPRNDGCIKAVDL